MGSNLVYLMFIDYSGNIVSAKHEISFPFQDITQAPKLPHE